jgi:hypothetical protein
MPELVQGKAFDVTESTGGRIENIFVRLSGIRSVCLDPDRGRRVVDRLLLRDVTVAGEELFAGDLG